MKPTFRFFRLNFIITAGHKKMLNSSAYEDLRKRNGIIADIIESKYNNTRLCDALNIKSSDIASTMNL